MGVIMGIACSSYRMYSMLSEINTSGLDWSYGHPLKLKCSASTALGSTVHKLLCLSRLSNRELFSR